MNTKRMLLSVMVLCTLLMMPSWPVNVHASDSVTVEIDVQYDQTEARTMLAMINGLRQNGDDTSGTPWYWNSDDKTKTVFVTGQLKPLQYDYNLERVAMQRAAEIAISYDHVRPNGKICFTAPGYSGYMASGENIAAGTKRKTAEGVFTSWAEHDVKYSEQGHRRNMLNPDYGAVGIAHVVYNGADYWVQEFGDSVKDDEKIPADDAKKTVSVETVGGTFTLYSNVSSLTFGLGEKKDLPTVSLSLKMTNTWPANPCPVRASCKWTSADPSIVAVSSNKLIANKRGNTTLTGTVNGNTISIPANVASFKDVNDGDWFADAVSWAVESGITSGVGAGKFGTNDPCTRGQIITFIYKAKGSKPSCSISFTDVKPSDYFYDPVRWAVENNITSGTGPNRFSPGSECTRGQVMMFLWKAAGSPKPESSVSMFSDVSRGDYFCDAVLWAVENGITGGTGKGRFSPNEKCTRAQAVTFLYKSKDL